MVDSNRLSIVIQGPISGNKANPKIYTQKCCDTARKCFPRAEVILSTWVGENTDGLSYDKCIKSDPPLLKKCIYEDGTEHVVSTNHLLISSKAGLDLCEREYVIKLRSDMAFKNDKCLSLIGCFNEYNESNLEWKVFDERLLTLPQLNPDRVDVWYPYSICDWIQVGQKKDVSKLYNIKLEDIDSIPIRPGMQYISSDDYLGAEQYLFHSVLEKNGLPVKLFSRRDGEGDIKTRNSIAIAMNMVLLSAKQLGVESLKYPGRMYAIEPCLSLGYYTHGEWRELYNKYGGGHLKHTKNIFEQAVYKGVYRLRKINGKKKWFSAR